MMSAQLQNGRLKFQFGKDNELEIWSIDVEDMWLVWLIKLLQEYF